MRRKKSEVRSQKTWWGGRDDLVGWVRRPGGVGETTGMRRREMGARVVVRLLIMMMRMRMRRGSESRKL